MFLKTKEEINWKDDSLHEDCPSLTPYFLKDKRKAPIIVVIPGGGYGHRAYHEGVPVAEWLNKNGYHAYVLRYNVAPIKDQEVIYKSKYAIQYARYYAESKGIKGQKLGVLGFSAGGHLAAMISNDFDEAKEDSNDPVLRYTSRPDFHLLCYPVISMGDYTHEGSKNNLLGENPEEALVLNHSCERLVTSQTSPAFIWSTANDQAVPVMNSLLYAQALQEHHIEYDLHIYQDGRHGLGLADDQFHTINWKEECISWLDTYIKPS